MSDLVTVTPAAAELIRSLREQHGPLMFHQSGGCCDGSAPMCYPAGEFRTGSADIRLAALTVDGVPEPVEFWISRAQWARWQHTRLTIDVVPGRGSGFSLESPEGLRFLLRSTLARREHEKAPDRASAAQSRVATDCVEQRPQAH
ncbi:DUF779 domain-containing protein [Salinispora mooreana]|uniref:DUF779 domain-containing protein n=1 Tax=Salinispora mooreana TaxID=999545 RepID=UPI00036B6269|nr:DUF779 domain-containing protein [Salinispora mooreana]